METQEFKFVRPNRVSRRVSDHIKGLILQRKLKAGDKLPPERELSKMIGVGRLSLREGLRILESVGILETRYGVGSGTFVSQIGLKDLVDKVSDFLRFADITIGELTEAGQEISLGIFKYFIERASEEDIKLLEDCVKETEKQIASGEKSREQAILFHELIAQGSKNTVFIIIHHSLMNLLRQVLAKFISPPEHSKRVLENQKMILMCLKEKNFERASLAMKDHMAYTAEKIKSWIGNSSQ